MNIPIQVRQIWLTPSTYTAYILYTNKQNYRNKFTHKIFSFFQMGISSSIFIGTELLLIL